MDVPTMPGTMAYNEPAKDEQNRKVRRFYNAAKKQLDGFTFKVHYNRGGIAVWGETYAKIYDANGAPVVEAYNTTMGLLVRQWDGRNSGANHFVRTLEQFVGLVRTLTAKPFVRF